jgi:hypothetical protein
MPCQIKREEGDETEEQREQKNNKIKDRKI